jgi:hypothetical protein
MKKLFRFWVFHLSGAWEVALPFPGNKIIDCIKKYQVGQATKWS